MNHRTVIQALPTLERRDAVGNYALQARKIFADMGFNSQIVCARASGITTPFILPASTLFKPLDDAIIFYHHSTGCDMADQIPQIHAARKILHYHNVTPPELFPYAPHAAAISHRGRAQTAALAVSCDLAIAASPFSAADLSAVGCPRVEIIPYAVPDDFAQLLATGAANRNTEPGNQRTLLYVGRMAPHKCVEDLIGVRRLLEAASADTRWVLRLVGSLQAGESYGAGLLRDTADERADGRVIFVDPTDGADLAHEYAAAHCLVVMSLHEGFCVPLAEAMFAELPTIVRAAGAMPHTIGDAGLVIGESDLVFFAEAITRVLADAPLRSRLRDAQRLQRAAYTEHALITRLRNLDL